MLVHDEKLGTGRGTRAVRCGVVSNLITHSRNEPMRTPVIKLNRQFTLQTEQNVALVAPVIRSITSGVLNHTHAYRSGGSCAPESGASLTAVFSYRHSCPIDGLKAKTVQRHTCRLRVENTA